ncbi:Translation initiation factor IF2 [Gracilaria domingensis]|nr:Translation initiation factor IF2 [Gracilaria domingensis]
MAAVREASEGSGRRARAKGDMKSSKKARHPQRDPEWRKQQYAQRRPSPSKRKPQVAPIREVVLPEIGLSSQQLAALAEYSEEDVFKVAKDLDDSIYTPRSVLTPALIELVTEELKLRICFKPQTERLVSSIEPDVVGKGDVDLRAPIITVMGHVDHGKTSLLDALRHSDVAKREAGGITQCVAAFQVPLSQGENGTEGSFATFIDTPGHAAFKAMRANGTVVTDIVVLVVAADDGVMPQTIEAANLARQANVPIIVAVNKCDVLGSDPERVRYQLLDRLGINTEQLGGDVQCVDISAKTGENLPQLLDAISLQADMSDLRTSRHAPGAGICLESRLDRAFGSVATVVVRSGTLRVGDIAVFQSPKVLRGELYGRVRSIIASDSTALEEAVPGMTVGVIGIKAAIPPGAEVHVVPNEKIAKAKSHDMIHQNIAAASTIELANSLLHKREEELALIREKELSQSEASEGDEQLDAHDEKQTLLVLVKGEVQGSADAVAQCIQSLETADLNVRILSVGVGDINDMDLKIISAGKQVKGSADEPLIVAFNVKAKHSAEKMAKRFAIPILSHSLIYHLEDDVKNRIHELVSAKKVVEEITGTASVVRVFEDGAIAGCCVDEGSLAQNDKVRVMRLPSMDSDQRTREEVFSGPVESIKRFAKAVRSVEKGTECGVSVNGWSSFEAGDVIEVITEKT